MSVNCNQLSTAVWIYDIDNYRIHWANPAALLLWEADDLTELLQRDFSTNTSEAVQSTLRDYRHTFEKNQSVSMFWRFTPKGITKEAFCQMSGYTFPDGRIGLQCEAIPSPLLKDHSQHNSIIMLSTYNMDGVFISANPAFNDQMGNAVEQFSQLFLTPEHSTEIIAAVKHQEIFESDYLLKTNSGNLWFHLKVSLSHANFTDSELLVQQFNIHNRKLEQIQLTAQVNTDPLTGLLNRRGLKELLEQYIRQNIEFFIYYIDLDSFKMINDSMGHSVGDLVLKTLAQRLQNNATVTGQASRFGGDEYIYIVEKNQSTLSQNHIAEQLITLTNRPYTDLEGNPLLISASVGSACYPDDGQDINKLLLRADAAMYMAKSKGKKRQIHYQKGMEDILQRRSLVAKHLHLAIKNSELSMDYQPIFDTTDNSIHSFEALLRWRNPLLGLVPAEETIQVAEQIGIIVELENWIIKQAIGDLPLLREATLCQAKIAINISGLHFTEPELPAFLLSVLAHNQLNTADLQIELTESTLIKDINEGFFCANELSNLGISLSIDDFGTGYSSLAYLHQIPANIVKIDNSFTSRMEQSAATITSIHHLLKSLKLTTLVEGVETPEQSSMLNLIGINLQQGYHLAHPKPLSYYLAAAKLKQSALLS
ncbi:MAG: EAL domain-containing protein [Oceanospirillaceae bacterium]|nr:EAL domain-containing protein [Oceanospirillaceae bacterium]